MKLTRTLLCLATLATVCAAAAVIQAAPPATQPAEDTATVYTAVLLDGKKIGHKVTTQTIRDGRVTTEGATNISINRLGFVIAVAESNTSVETTDGKPISFKSVLNNSLMVGKSVTGTVDEKGQITATVNAGGQIQQTTLPWPKGAVMAYGATLLQRKHGLKEGTKYTIKMFHSNELTTMDTAIEVGQKKQIDLFGRVVELTELQSTVESPMGKVTSYAYCDDNLYARKGTASLAGMQMVFIECSKAFALSKNSQVDFFSKLTVKSPTPLTKAGNAKAITYHLRNTGDGKLKFPDTDNQKVLESADGKTVLAVRPAPVPKGGQLPYDGKDPELLKALAATDTLQTKDPKIIELTRKAVGDAKDPAVAVKRIETFVDEYIDTKDLSVGYASASEVARSRQGDCTEHAVLLVAMCRAAGIPAQVVVGMGYAPQIGQHSDIFGPHAWGRAYVGGKWIGLDAALGYDARHIAMGYGDGKMEDFFGAITTMGNFTIDKVKVDK